MTLARRPQARSGLRAVIGLSLLSACVGGAPSTRTLPPAERAPAPRYSVSQPTLLPEELTIPLEARDNGMFAPTYIDGRPVGDFLVDTGSNATIINESLADELGLPVVADTELGGVHATTQSSVRTVARLSVGDLQLDSSVTVATALDDVGGRGETALAGILGFTALGPAPFALDFAKARLTVYNPAHFVPPANVTREILRFDQSLPYVEATLANDQSVFLLFDSGARISVALWRPFVDAHPEVLTVPLKNWGLMTGGGGGRVVMTSELRVLRLFGRELTNVKTSIQDPPSYVWRHPRAVGIVGLDVLRNFRVTIDPGIRRIWAEPL